jgi:radical S-adenosyl methionine domain-containing protein 2
VFQCLLIGGENTGEDALRNAKEFVTSDEEFQSFISRHGNIGCHCHFDVPESNEKVCAVFYVSITAAKCSSTTP